MLMETIDNDCISRRDAIDALWKAMYEYEDKTEKQFQESDELDIGDWILHRIFVQNMSDIDRQTILNLPSSQPEIIRCKDCKYWNSGSCEYREHAVNCDGYSVGDIETEAEHFCGYVEKREVTEWTM
jgi:hypothetical protein